MFGFNIVGLLVIFYAVVGTIGALLVIFVCMASKNSTQIGDRLFAQYKLEQKNSKSVTKTTLPSHARPTIAHRFLATAESATEEEKPSSKSVQQSDKQATSKGHIHS